MSVSSAMGGGVTPLLREAWPQHTSKMAARAARVPLETARSWVKGYSIPSAATFLNMADNDPAFALALEARAVEARLHHRRAERAERRASQGIAYASSPPHSVLAPVPGAGDVAHGSVRQAGGVGSAPVAPLHRTVTP